MQSIYIYMTKLYCGGVHSADVPIDGLLLMLTCRVDEMHGRGRKFYYSSNLLDH